jgi:hypothetical protein
MTARIRRFNKSCPKVPGAITQSDGLSAAIGFFRRRSVLLTNQLERGNAAVTAAPILAKKLVRFVVL